ncbi:MAG: 1-(5-phosphoribosyl)-5-[(5-phosphoribosylamino)methylideneamino]imidazole-4-carboxamide isomerase [Oscillospiraceae bacterium]
MIIFPAIDIQNGQCVRLSQGDFSTSEQVADDPLKTALSFKEAGAEWIHMVDLDGAKTATQPNKLLFLEIAKETGLKIELGGGIRDFKTAQNYLENGIERVILGSAAVKNPRLIADLVRDYGDRIIVGIDAKNGIAQTEGWLSQSKVNYLTLAREMQEIGVHHIVYTDISKDGTLKGPNLFELKKINAAVKINIIASGGISNIEDIKAIKKLGLYGAICGKSIYKKTLDLKEALLVARGE